MSIAIFFIDESTSDPLLPIIEESVASCIPCKIYIDHILSIEELDEALYSMDLKKSLGIYRLSTKFYRALWLHIHEYFYYVYLEGI